jgi:lipoprotein-anchoring transpeptidase ErfK/SrfK
MLRVIVMFFSTLLFTGSVFAEDIYVTPSSSGSEVEAVSPKTSTHHKIKRHHKSQNTFPMQRAATGSRVFIFNPRTHAYAAYNENGERVKTGRASGGRAFCRDIRRQCKTIVGTFSVLSKGGAYCKSNIYPIKTGGGAPMPYCMRFSEKGYAIHGSSSVPNYNASHGCIRVTPADAKWLSQNFIQTGTKVMVMPY